MWDGRIEYLTGGTTSTPRRISYDWARWNRSVHVKSRLFREYGLDAGARIAVCHPFAPWAMGSVFAEGALSVGATVLPLGLEVHKEAFYKVLLGFEPTHLCGAPRSLMRLAQGLSKSQEARAALAKVEIAFVAGEKLTGYRRTSLGKVLECSIVDVYGMAEFDMVAAQLPGSANLCLVPDFEFAIRLFPDGGLRPLECGLTGELAVSHSNDGPWHQTSDKVEVINRVQGWTGQRPTWEIRFIERLDGSATFACGAMIASAQVSSVIASLPELEFMQVLVTHDFDGDEVEILCVSKAGADSRLPERAMQELLRVALDMSDSHSHGLIRNIRSRIATDGELFTTPRGKTPYIVER